MKTKKSKVTELSLEEKIETDGGFMLPIGWIADAAVAVSGFVADAKAAYKLLTE